MRERGLNYYGQHKEMCENLKNKNGKISGFIRFRDFLHFSKILLASE
jgi:hypothetical protein